MTSVVCSDCGGSISIVCATPSYEGMVPLVSIHVAIPLPRPSVGYL